MPGPQGLTLRPTSQESVGPHRRVPGLALHCRHELQKRPLQHSAPSVPGGGARIAAGGRATPGDLPQSKPLSTRTCYRPRLGRGWGSGAFSPRGALLPGDPGARPGRADMGPLHQKTDAEPGEASPSRGEGWEGSGQPRVPGRPGATCTGDKADVLKMRAGVSPTPASD